VFGIGLVLVKPLLRTFCHSEASEITAFAKVRMVAIWRERIMAGNFGRGPSFSV
jgi:hypothetical protein